MMAAVPSGAAVADPARRIRIASNTRRSANERATLTRLKARPMIRFWRSVVCSPKIGKIRICVTTATP